MKSLISILTITFLVGCLFWTSSCKSTKIADQEESYPMYLMLKTHLSGDYIEETYSNFNPEKVKAANKTLNQYRVIFTCTVEAKDELNALLKGDPNIISIEFGEGDPSLEKSSSTSGKVIKSTPKSARR